MPVTFQSLILKLQEFWASHGCLIGQPYYTQVGAGTMNPATFLRVLGPEPWKVAYVEPSVRPDDGRYGENPNRFQLHYQFQVILKPDPGNPQELYLDSLKAIGVDPRQHDIRFIEDNWEQPALGAWGLGWEVWLDGQEITQFTYFQQAGGYALDPVSVELTYGLERIAIALRNADAIWDVPWSEQVTYGEMRKTEEYEHSKYYFEIADVERLRQMFNLFEAEVDAALDAGLILPAYDYLLKCSHAFNVLDTRGAVGVTERQALFGRTRELARRVATAYLEQRMKLEYPLLKDEGGRRKDEAPVMKPSDLSSFIIHPSSFLFEIGTEELPAVDLDSAIVQLKASVPALLNKLRLEHSAVSVFGTPRRLTVHLESLAPKQTDREELAKGPPAERAFDKDGKPTQAALGFARGKGVDVKDLEVREMDGGKYVVAIVKQSGCPTPEVLMDALPGLVAGIKFDKSMRWNQTNVAFSRPVRWLVALLGEIAITFEYAGLTAGRLTRGLRPYDSPEITVPSAEKYFDVVREAGIVLNGEARKAAIVEQVKKAAASVGGEAMLDPDLLAEVTNLVEKPTAVLGKFNPDFLALPRDVLISVMTKHQRYFPIVSRAPVSSVKSNVTRDTGTHDTLLPYFVVVRNGDDKHLDLVRQGNEHVLGARYADADFFVREDIKHKLEDFRPRLGTLIFQAKLGSMLDKAGRIENLTGELAAMLGLSAEERGHALRAAHLCKADLVTKMVIEMTSLQGVMGREYALRSGETPAVAAAIGEQYQTVPQSKAGLAVALADRLDSLAGLFAAGLAPTGAKDPFGLRRAALGVVQPLIEHDIDFDLRAALKSAAALEPIAVTDETQAQVLEFITGRLRALLLDSGYRYDAVDAVLAAQARNPASAAHAVKQLSVWVARPDWHEILPAYARCVRILRSSETGVESRESLVVNPAAFVEDAEQSLFEALQKAEADLRGTPHVTPDTFLNAFLPMIPAVNKFFDDVLVMTEDERLRANRLALIGKVAALAEGVADMSKMEGF